MKRLYHIVLIVIFLYSHAVGQNIQFVEYDLPNGLHVILHEDKTVPLAVTSVMYHVGAKNEDPNRRGFAHFFEHLLFEGTENISRGEFMKIVERNGGSLNANTTQDRTYYYELFPSNKVNLALWLESERMLHPVINQIGVDTQNEVVKEEKRLRYDNRPYGQLLPTVMNELFDKHPYRWTTIGEMDHLDQATLEEFLAFNETYYVPNNAVLVVAGNIDIGRTRQVIADYFSDIPRGAEIPRNIPMESQEIQAKRLTVTDPNIQIPMVLLCYRTPSMTQKDTYALELISTLLSGGKSSMLYKRLVEEKKIALDVQAINLALEDYGVYIIYAMPIGTVSLDTLIEEIDYEMKQLKDTLITKREYEKLQNVIENNVVNANATMAGIAHSLAHYYTFYSETQLINTEFEYYQAVTREDIMNATQTYLDESKRVIIDYIPEEIMP